MESIFDLSTNNPISVKKMPLWKVSKTEIYDGSSESKQPCISHGMRNIVYSVSAVCGCDNHHWHMMKKI